MNSRAALAAELQLLPAPRRLPVRSRLSPALPEERSPPGLVRYRARELESLARVDLPFACYFCPPPSYFPPPWLLLLLLLLLLLRLSEHRLHVSFLFLFFSFFMASTCTLSSSELRSVFR